MSAGRGVMRGMETFTLVPRGPFSLAASIRFLEGFTPASYSHAPDGVLELAFPAEGSWRTVGVRVSQAGEKVDAEIQRRYPGLRPVGFWSPYEAAACAER